jgi:hypothetical protein
VHFVNSKVTRHRIGRCPTVPGGHHHPKAGRMQRLDGCRRAVLDGVGHSDQSSDAAIHGEEHRRGSVEAQPLGTGGQGGNVRRGFLRQRGIAQGDRMVIDTAPDTEAGHRLKLLGPGQGKAASFGLCDDGIGQRVLAALVETGGQSQHFICRNVVVPDHFAEGRSSLRQRAGLIDD